jgi:hypothetical protein
VDDIADLFDTASFSYQFGQKVKIRAPHPEAGATGPVTNAYLFRDGREEVFVSVPGGVGIYHADELEPAGNRGYRIDHRPLQTDSSTLPGERPNGNGSGRSGDVSGM